MDALPEAVADKRLGDGINFSRALGKYLSTNEGRFAGNHVVRKAGVNHHTSVWRIDFL
jgi:hypothetical protein